MDVDNQEKMETTQTNEKHLVRKISSTEIIVALQQRYGDICWMIEINDKFACYQSRNLDHVKEELLNLLQREDFKNVFHHVSSPDCIDCFLLSGEPGQVIMMGEAIGVPFYACMTFPDDKMAENIRQAMLSFCHTLIKEM